jgi:hypothetical protein
MAKLSVFLALCFFFCLASAQLDSQDLIIEFDAALLTAGTNASTWTNTGSLGGFVTAVASAPAVLASCGARGQGVSFNGESFGGAPYSPVTFGASDAAVVIVVASSTGNGISGLLTTGVAPLLSETDVGPGVFYNFNLYEQDADLPAVGSVNTFHATIGNAVAVAFVYETPIGSTANDYWITADNSGTNIVGAGTDVVTTIDSFSIGDRLGVAAGFMGCIHYLAVYQVPATPVSEDALSATLLDLATRFAVPTNTTVSPSPAPGTTGTATTGTATTGSRTTGSRTTGSKATTGNKATTHMSSASLPAVHSVLFAAIVSFFLFFLW